MMIKINLLILKVMVILSLTLLQKVITIIKVMISKPTTKMGMTTAIKTNTKGIQAMSNNHIRGSMINSNMTNITLKGNIHKLKFRLQTHLVLKVKILKFNHQLMLAHLICNQQPLQIQINKIRTIGINITNTMDHIPQLNNNRLTINSIIQDICNLTVELILNKYRDNQELKLILKINNSKINSQPNEQQTLIKGKMIDF